MDKLYGQPGSDAYLAEYDTAGNYISAIPFNGTNGSFQFGVGVCIIPPNKVGVTGFFSATTIDFDPGAGVHNLSVNGGSSSYTDAFVATYTYNTVGIDAQFRDANLFSVYPNPANENLILTLSQGEGTAVCELKIFDVMGMEIKKLAAGSHQLAIDVSKFENGIYFIQLASENKTSTQKLIIQH